MAHAACTALLSIVTACFALGAFGCSGADAGGDVASSTDSAEEAITVLDVLAQNHGKCRAFDGTPGFDGAWLDGWADVEVRKVKTAKGVVEWRIYAQARGDMLSNDNEVRTVIDPDGVDRTVIDHEHVRKGSWTLAATLPAPLHKTGAPPVRAAVVLQPGDYQGVTCTYAVTYSEWDAALKLVDASQ